jgi:hypothetical protein
MGDWAAVCVTIAILFGISSGLGLSVAECVAIAILFGISSGLGLSIREGVAIAMAIFCVSFCFGLCICRNGSFCFGLCIPVATIILFCVSLCFSLSKRGGGTIAVVAIAVRKWT